MKILPNKTSTKVKSVKKTGRNKRIRFPGKNMGNKSKLFSEASVNSMADFHKVGKLFSRCSDLNDIGW